MYMLVETCHNFQICPFRHWSRAMKSILYNRVNSSRCQYCSGNTYHVHGACDRYMDDSDDTQQLAKHAAKRAPNSHCAPMRASPKAPLIVWPYSVSSLSDVCAACTLEWPKMLGLGRVATCETDHFAHHALFIVGRDQATKLHFCNHAKRNLDQKLSRPHGWPIHRYKVATYAGSIFKEARNVAARAQSSVSVSSTHGSLQRHAREQPTITQAPVCSDSQAQQGTAQSWEVFVSNFGKLQCNELSAPRQSWMYGMCIRQPCSLGMQGFICRLGHGQPWPCGHRGRWLVSHQQQLCHTFTHAEGPRAQWLQAGTCGRAAAGARFLCDLGIQAGASVGVRAACTAVCAVQEVDIRVCYQSASAPCQPEVFDADTAQG
eukprot:scaffold222364_cov18-Tisochrysis_lutea.AAC.1